MYSTYFNKNHQHKSAQKALSSVSRVPPRERTDRHDEANSHFTQPFCKGA